MKTDYSGLQKAIKKADDESFKLIGDFEKALAKQGFVKKTITRHINNIEFLLTYINCYELEVEDVRTIDKTTGGDLSTFSTSFSLKKQCGQAHLLLNKILHRLRSSSTGCMLMVTWIKMISMKFCIPSKKKKTIGYKALA
jgi:hypothetical protein